MGLEGGYIVPENYDAAYHLVRDGVVVPVVAYLYRHLLAALLRANKKKQSRGVINLDEILDEIKTPLFDPVFCQGASNTLVVAGGGSKDALEA